jgi:hypothetical protein
MMSYTFHAGRRVDDVNRGTFSNGVGGAFWLARSARNALIGYFHCHGSFSVYDFCQVLQSPDGQVPLGYQIKVRGSNDTSHEFGLCLSWFSAVLTLVRPEFHVMQGKSQNAPRRVLRREAFAPHSWPRLWRLRGRGEMSHLFDGELDLGQAILFLVREKAGRVLGLGIYSNQRPHNLPAS